MPAHPAVHTGPVRLVVPDLAHSLGFYTNILGFRVLDASDTVAVLTADGTSPLLELTGDPGAPARPAFSTGLFHFAVLMPTRYDLARSLWRLVESGYPLSGASDHQVSEALYLDDPNGIGIELYRDRPRDEWPRRDGAIQMATLPLDLDGLFAEAGEAPPEWSGLAPGTVMGHVHLQVSDLAAAEAFYRDVLGLELMVRYGGSASFLAAGGYHHHIGLNIWNSRGAPQPPPGAVGLRSFTMLVPSGEELDRILRAASEAGAVITPASGGAELTDPSGNVVRLAVEERQPASAE